MSDNYLQSQLFSGAVRGLTEGYASSLSPQAKAQRSEALLIKEQRDQQLAALKASRATPGQLDQVNRVNQQKMDMLEQTQLKTLQDSAKQTTYQALDKFFIDKDVRHLNAGLNQLKLNPASADLWADAIRIDKLAPGDMELVKQFGLDPKLLEQNPELDDNLVKVTLADGSVSVRDVTDIAVEAEYDKYTTNQNIEKLKKTAEIYKAYGIMGATNEMERTAGKEVIAMGIAPGSAQFFAAQTEVIARLKAQEAQNKLNQKAAGAKKGDSGFSMEKLYKQYGMDTEAQQTAGLPLLLKAGVIPEDVARTLQDFPKAVGEELSNKRATAVQKNNTDKNEARQNIDTIAKTEFGKDYFDLTMDAKTRRKFEPEIERMEQVGGLALDAATEKRLIELGRITPLAQKASAMGKNDTGLIDSTFNQVKKFVFDTPGNADKTAAWSSIQNLRRNALFGSALTNGEKSAFVDESGSLKEGLGPVLVKTKQALEQTLTDYQTIANLGNSYITKFRFGVDQDKLEDITNALQQRIDFMDEALSGSAQQTPSRQSPNSSSSILTPEKMSEMDKLLEGSN